MSDAQAVPPPADATAAYFAATEDGPFDHQRDAYEAGYDAGRAQAAAAERERAATAIVLAREALAAIGAQNDETQVLIARYMAQLIELEDELPADLEVDLLDGGTDGQ